MTQRSSKRVKVGVVIPAYKVREQILKVIDSIGSEVSEIVVVDDACPDESGRVVIEKCKDPRVKVITLESNLGVGGATKAGYQHLLNRRIDIAIKLDGDGQMDAKQISNLIAPIQESAADYTKGNRFFSLAGIAEMPKIRLIGNALLSLISKASSGYWNILDPNNGFTAIDVRILRRLELDKISNRYFFESDMLHRLYLLRAKVTDVSMLAIYGDEKSNLSLFKSGIEFPIKHLRNLFRRLFLTYIVRDFSLPTFQLLCGTPLLFFGLAYGIEQFQSSLAAGVQTAPGTLIVVAISILGGVQLLSGFLTADFENTPKESISSVLE